MLASLRHAVRLAGPTAVSLIAALSGALLVACGPTRPGNGGGGDDDDHPAGECTPGEQRSCYEGPSGTEGVGRCRAGAQVCGSDGLWTSCDGQVVPEREICGNGIDDNCSGQVDEDLDLDGDGFTSCAGNDCCDSVNDGCGSPELVNPGAFEAAGNSVDDDCDGQVDNAVAVSCDGGLASDSASAMDYAKALELCQTATMADRRWGVIEAAFSLPSGTGTPNAGQRSIRPVFGGTTVRGGSSFVVLSTGRAAAQGQTAPNYAAFQGGQRINTSSAVPADWLAANGGALPNAPGCPSPNGGTTARDPIMLTLKLRVPTNARSFKLATNFMSAEYPEWVCSPYNDFFIVLLDSTWAGTPANPPDKNLAVYTSPAMQRYPVGVNLAHGNTGLFQQCMNGPTGCTTEAENGTINTCTSTGELIGTGMDVANPGSTSSEPGYCGTNNLAGGGTGWLVTSGNVVGGEVITLRIALWDTSDGYYDSVSLIDKFEWSVEAAEPGTVIY
jgi:hypothetical protein